MDLVQLSTSHLIKYCATNEPVLKNIHAPLSAETMKAKLIAYKEKLVQLPAIVCAYLNPQITKPTDPVTLSIIKGHIQGVLDQQLSMIEIEQHDWVEEVLDDGVVSMLNIQFDNMIADESDMSAL